MESERKREAEEILGGESGDGAKKAKVGKEDAGHRKDTDSEWEDDGDWGTEEEGEEEEGDNSGYVPPEKENFPTQEDQKIPDKSKGRPEGREETVASDLPPAEVLNAMIDRMGALLPKNDGIKFDSRAKKIDWTKVAFEGMDAGQCKKWWYHIQERIRRYRIMAELLPDARAWVSQPWTNFYKSKEHNRKPGMPKKPPTAYFLFLSERRGEILKSNPKMHMSEVTKVCSEEYAKLSERGRREYKARCEEMQREYETKVAEFYNDNPHLRPTRAEKHKKAPPTVVATPGTTVMNLTKAKATAATPAPAPAPPQPIVTVASSPTKSQSQLPVGTTNVQQQAHVVPSSNLAYPNAPKRPPKPFDLYLKSEMDSHVDEMNFDRQRCAEKCRLDWKKMKTTKKGKWIQVALGEYKKYEERVGVFMRDNGGYVPPAKKNFLTQEDQKTLDKFMGRPEKPPTSAYSLFSKEMLNNPEIKQYPSKERMTQIGIMYKMLDQTQKDMYQARVNESMDVYSQEYENWCDKLNEEQKQAERERGNMAKNKQFNPAPPGAIASASGSKKVTQQGGYSVLS